MSLETLIDAFTQSQKTLSNHNKNHINLRKYHKQILESEDEKAYTTFVKAFIGSITRTFEYPKSKAYADRVIAFATTYLSYSNAKDTEEAGQELEESPAMMLTSDILRHLLKGFNAKDKYVRFRCVQVSNLIISVLGAMDEDLFDALLDATLERMNDKETNIRQQATLALCKLQASDDDRGSIAKSLKAAITTDPTAAVRKTAVMNVFPTQDTVPALLTRARDVDPATRKAVFEGSKLSEALKDVRSIRLSPRENLIRTGLGDRDPTVKKACVNLLSAWIDRADKNIQVFLEYFDVIDSKVAEDALLSIFNSRLDIFHSVQFDDAMWTKLTPEQALLARVYVDYCVATEDYQKLENLPVVTAMAFHIQHAYNQVVTLAQNYDDSDEYTDNMVNSNYILGELLKLAINLDYGDEIGRRKIFGLVRDFLSSPSLPEPLIPIALDILYKLSSSERDFLLLTVELISELRDLRVPEEEEDDDIGDGGSTVMMTPAKPKQTAAKVLSEAEIAHNAELDLRSLAVVIGMLERVNTTLVENSALGGILPDLVIPSVKSKEAMIRERGLHALGLICLLADTLAIGSFQMFMNQAETAPEPLNIQSLKVVIDLLMTHDVSHFAEKGGLGLEYICHFLLRSLDGHSPEYQAVSCEGVSKLMLSGMINDASLLRGLLYVYFSPEVADNQPLRQCLSYFFPVFAFSSKRNQARLAEIALIAISDHWDRDSDEQSAVTVSQVATLLSEWTDPLNLVNPDNDELLQSRLALDTLKELFKVDIKEDRKVLVQFLQKLNISANTPIKEIWLMIKLVDELQNEKPLADALSRNALVRFNTGLYKKFKELSEVDGENLDYQESLDDVYKDVGINQDEDATPVKKIPKTAPTPRAASKYGDRYAVGYKKQEKQPTKRKVSNNGNNSSRIKQKKKEYSSSEEEAAPSDVDSDSTEGNKGSPIAKPKLSRQQPLRRKRSSREIAISEEDEAADDSEDEVASVL
ncbi:hypothetical protein E3Q23_01567 [Wallemia mellicola]|uniref:Nuclear condensin complex subunit 3 C-terminal domain-containing protein n=1 Tax=Wallemia mellicola TaxID=1708541 RepID=A0A4T0M430_9BASI|nr:hypothetical protein E3Q23_01567 [Wallemia mellicola]TIC27446.1 hypothetical protein E3Q11_02383 [Wallemia mellicola]TIC31008.1 hypothetical protein E3Q10_01863 [Wallemia mellicola]TIC74319.1 hypothetical protein E3Q00_02038 [Wallemia mellicola]